MLLVLLILLVLHKLEIMVSLSISLLITALLILIPAFAYGNTSNAARGIYLRMLSTTWCKFFLANILAALVIAFHLTFYQTHRGDIGLYISSCLVFAALASSKVLVVLKAICRNNITLVRLFMAIIIVAFVPHFLSLAISLAFILEAACFYPGRLSDFIDKRELPELTNGQLARLYFGS